MLGYWALLPYSNVTMYCHGIYMQAVHVQCLLALVPHTTYSCLSITRLVPTPPAPPLIWAMVECWSLNRVRPNSIDHQAVWCRVMTEHAVLDSSPCSCQRPALSLPGQLPPQQLPHVVPRPCRAAPGMWRFWRHHQMLGQTQEQPQLGPPADAE